MAGGKGFEPLQADPESAVLPLDEPPMISAGYSTISLDNNQEILFYSSVSAFIRRWRTRSRPMISILSNSGGLTF